MNKKLLLALAFSALTSRLECIRLFVEDLESPSKYNYSIDVENTTTIKQVKELLGVKTRHNPSTIRLFIERNELVDTKTLEEYDFHRHKILMKLSDYFQIYIYRHRSNLDTTYMPRVQNNTTIEELKRMIAAETKDPVSEILLFIDGTELKNKETVGKYDLKRICSKNHEITMYVSKQQENVTDEAEDIFFDAQKEFNNE